MKLAATEQYERFFVIFPELLPCLKVALYHGLEQEFIEKLILKVGSAAFTLLKELLKHPDAKVRARAARLLKKGHYSELHQELEQFFFDQDERVRQTGKSLLQEIINGKNSCRSVA